MRRRALILTAITALLATLAGCSEPEPESSSTTTAPSSETTACRDDLLACARESTIGDIVPDEATEATGEPIVLGMINQDNTPAASFPELSQADQAAVEFINEQLGGVGGRPLELLVCNTQFSTEGSAACGQQMVEAGVPAVLGGIDVFGTAIDTLADNGIPWVGGIPVSTQSMTDPLSFQWSGGTWGATIAFADHAIHEVEAERVSILYGEFGSIEDSAQYGRTVLERAGVEVQMVPFPIISTDISSPLQAAASTDPDAIVILAADTGCKPAFDGVAALDLDAETYFVGACAAPTILADVGDASEGAVFNVEGPIEPGPDVNLYSEVIERYGDGLDAAGAGTVSFRSLMNLYVLLVELGPDAITADAIVDALRDQVDTASFMGHPYTCDGEQLEGLPATCSPQQILGRIEDGSLVQISDWIDVGQIYEG